MFKSQSNSVSKNRKKTEEQNDDEDVKFSSRSFGEEKNDFAESLGQIYKNENGQIPDMSKLERGRPQRSKIVFIGFNLLLLVLAVVAWTGFWMFTRQSGEVSDENVKIEIQGDKEVYFGQTVSFDIAIKNTGAVAVKNAELVVDYPQNFTFASSTLPAESELKNIFNVGNIESQKSVNFSISGQVGGEVEMTQGISATLEYTPVNFSSRFKASGYANQEVKKSVVLDLQSPDQVVAGEAAKITIKYKNITEHSLDNFTVRFLPPEEFIFSTSTATSTPALAGDKKAAAVNATSTEQIISKAPGEWQFADLAPQAEGNLEVSGKFVSSNQKEILIKTEGGLSIDKNFIVGAKAEKTIELLGAKGLLIGLAVNGFSTDNSVDVKKPLEYVVTYENAGDKELNDISLSINIDSKYDILDWDTLTAAGASAAGKAVVWDKKEVPDFVSLKPGNHGQLDFTINLKPISYLKNLDAASMVFTSQAVAKVAKLGGKKIDMTAQSVAIVSQINTDIELKVEGRYYDDNNSPIGSGPLPPKLGVATNYRINWVLENNIHEVEKLKISAKLPTNVTFVVKKDITAGEVLYDSASRTVTWSINRLPVGLSQAIRVSFDISVSPTPDDVGRVLLLTSKANLSAIDKQTKVEIKKEYPAITSALKGDPGYSGDGVVVE